MRQILLGGKVAYASGTDLSKVADGAIGVFYNKNGVPTASTTGKEFTGEAMLVLGRPSDKGGPVVLPIHSNNFSCVKGVYAASTTFSAEVTIPAPTKIGDYSLIVALKGVKFNERNKWTAMVHVKDVTITAADLATKLAAQINNNSEGSGVTAVASQAKITIKANKAGVDYEILGADELFGVAITVSAHGIPAYGDAKYVQDLAEKAAADAGFEYTYRDTNYYLYPNYPLNPLAQPNAADVGYTIFTLRFAEPRDVKTRDEVVNQIIQVAFPTGADAITTFETVCKGLGKYSSSNGSTTNSGGASSGGASSGGASSGGASSGGASSGGNGEDALE